MKYSGQYITIGPPGSGKTTWIAKQVKAICDRIGGQTFPGNSPVMVCSLTRASAAQAAGRDLPIPRQFIGTLHSMAYQRLGHPVVAESIIDDWNKSHPNYALGRKVDLDEMDNPGWDRPTAKAGEARMREYQNLRARMTARSLWPRTVLGFAAEWEQWKAATGAIDFTDMIEMALNDGGPAPGCPEVILADEAQDHSALELALLKDWGQQAGALILTGDPWQAIFCWRGAHPEMFLDTTIPDDHRRVLSQSYRVPRRVHAAAMAWIRSLSTWTAIKYNPRDAEGAMGKCRATWKRPEPAVEDAQRYAAEGKSVMLLASCGYQLRPLLAVLRKQGVPFCHPWRRDRADWNPLGTGKEVSMASRILDLLRLDMPTWGEQSRWWTPREVHNWASVLRADGVLRRGAKALLAEAAADGDRQAPVDAAFMDARFEPEAWWDLFDLLQARWPGGGGGDLGAVTDWWKEKLLGAKVRAANYPLRIVLARGPAELIARPCCRGDRDCAACNGGRIHVGTVHSFKGAECDVVFLFPDLSPAGWRQWAAGGLQRDEVVRMIYVAMTRARERLALCQAQSAMAVDLRRAFAAAS